MFKTVYTGFLNGTLLGTTLAAFALGGLSSTPGHYAGELEIIPGEPAETTSTLAPSLEDYPACQKKNDPNRIPETVLITGHPEPRVTLETASELIARNPQPPVWVVGFCYQEPS